MSALGLPIIDNAVQDANRWINEVNERVGWDNKQRAYRLLRQVLHVLRDHVGTDEAAQLGAQLPTLIRGIYYEGWNPSRTPARIRKPGEFIGAVQAGFAADPLGDAPEAIAAVMAVLDAHVSPGEMEDVRGRFTPEIRGLLAGETV